MPVEHIILVYIGWINPVRLALYSTRHNNSPRGSPRLASTVHPYRGAEQLQPGRGRRLEIRAPLPPMQSRELEARLGTRLLGQQRNDGPTLDGQAFYERCVHVLSELDDAESSLRHVASNPRGTLRVDMHNTHATKIVLPGIDDFRARYPGIDLVVSSGDRLVDLVREGVDCVVRAGNPRDSSLVARRLAVMPQVICASPEYFAYFGTPRHPDELSAHQVVKFFSSSGTVDYALELLVGGQVHEFALEGLDVGQRRRELRHLRAARLRIDSATALPRRR